MLYILYEKVFDLRFTYSFFMKKYTKKLLFCNLYNSLDFSNLYIILFTISHHMICAKYCLTIPRLWKVDRLWTQSTQGSSFNFQKSWRMCSGWLCYKCLIVAIICMAFTCLWPNSCSKER